MGHKIILCVNERGILLASLCSGGRGSVAGGRGTRGSRRSSEKRVNTQPALAHTTAEAPATGCLGRAVVLGLGHGFGAGVGGMNVYLLLHPLYASDLSSGLGERVVQHRCVGRREPWRFGSRRKAWGFQW